MPNEKTIVIINLPRMQKALASQTTTIPRKLTREEIRKLISEKAKE